MTNRSRYTFKVKEHVDGTPWILLAPFDSALKPLGHGALGFDLADGTTTEEADALAERLNA